MLARALRVPFSATASLRQNWEERSSMEQGRSSCSVTDRTPARITFLATSAPKPLEGGREWEGRRGEGEGGTSGGGGRERGWGLLI